MAHTVDRVFLGWDRPALPSAAAHLIQHYAEGAVADLRPATVVLPGRRARRRIIELLLDEAEARGVTLIPPAATTVGHLPGLLHASPRPLADEVISLRAWSQALRSVDRTVVEQVFPHLPENDGLAEWDELAGLLAGLHQTLAGEGHRFADVVKLCRSGMSYDDGARWEALGRVQRRYVQLLEKAGLADRFEARMAALESDVPPFTGDLWLLFIVELPAVTRRLVEASGAVVRTLIHAPEVLGDGTDATTVFDPFGLPSTEYWESAPVPVTDQILEVVERPVDQAESVIDALAGLGGKYSAPEVVLGVHSNSEVVPYLEQRLEARGVPPRYAAGTPLSRMGSVRLLGAIADYLDEGSFEALAALLRHPDAGALTRAVAANGPAAGVAAAAGLESIEWADAYFNIHLPFTVGSEMPAGKRQAARLPPVVRALAWDGPLESFGGRKRLSQWMPVVMDVLLGAYGNLELDRSNPGHRRLLDTLDRVRAVAGALSATPAPLDEQCAGSAAIRTLLLGLRDEALPHEPVRDAVELLDWLELPLDDAPVVVLTGFNEGLLPESVSGHAFLPDALRTRLRLPDNRSRLARDAYRLTTVLHSKASVLLIAGRRTAQGDPLRPSRLMFRIPEEQIPARVLQFLKRDGGGSAGSSLASLGLQPGERSAFTVPPEKVIQLRPDEVPDRLAVTAFKALLSDPYRFVLQAVYELDSIDDTARELDPLGFGSLAHHILDKFASRALESPPRVDVADESAVARALMTLLDEEMSTRFGDHALPAVYLQAQQLEVRLRAFAGKQAEWAAQGWRIVGVECKPENEGVPFDVDGTPFVLKGRIDRIDHNASTGEWAVLDYKTGNSVDPPDETHRTGKGDDRRWVDLQLPLYRLFLAGIVDQKGRPLVDAKAVERGKVRFGYVSLPRNTEDCEFMLADWSKDDFASAEAAAREAVRRLRKGTFEYDPNVTKVGWYGEDALKPLLTVGWQGTSEDAEVAFDHGSGEEEGSE
ncbi:MAG: PD-(D/E)XK nuclease family protein [Gemmatimonadetes bacterium]|nr:PD-(D/E)XK nuclease family protein [Gemmatimonadota bacterium]